MLPRGYLNVRRPPRILAAFKRWLEDEYQRIGAPRKSCLSIACLLYNLPERHTDNLSAPARNLLRRFIVDHLKDEARCFLQTLKQIHDNPDGIPPEGRLPNTVDFFEQTPPDPFALSNQQLAHLVTNAQALIKTCEPYNFYNEWSVSFPLGPTNVSVSKTKHSLDEYYSGDPRSVFLINAITELRKLGKSGIRFCPLCSRVFYTQGKKLYCRSECREATKRTRQEAKPLYNESKAFLMWKKKFRETHGGRNPSSKTAALWRKTYGEKRQRRQAKEQAKRPPRPLPMHLAQPDQAVHPIKH